MKSFATIFKSEERTFKPVLSDNRGGWSQRSKLPSAVKVRGTVPHVLIPKVGSTNTVNINFSPKVVRFGSFSFLSSSCESKSKMMGTARMPSSLPSDAGDESTGPPPRDRDGPFASDAIEIVLMSRQQRTLFRDKVSTISRVFLFR